MRYADCKNLKGSLPFMKKQNENPAGANPEEEKKNTVLQEILSWVEVLAAAIVLAWLITSFIIVNATVPTDMQTMDTCSCYGTSATRQLRRYMSAHGRLPSQAARHLSHATPS